MIPLFEYDQYDQYDHDDISRPPILGTDYFEGPTCTGCENSLYSFGFIGRRFVSKLVQSCIAMPRLSPFRSSE